MYDAPKQPERCAFYLEDNYEAKNIQINLGLKYINFSSDALVYPDPRNVEFNYSAASSNIPLSGLETAPSHEYYLPRFNIIFNTSDRLTLHFQYGKYAEYVKLQDVYGDSSIKGTLDFSKEVMDFIKQYKTQKNQAAHLR